MNETNRIHKSVLTEAESLVHGSRNAAYGSPLDSFQRTAKMWSAILGHEIQAEQVGLCMIALKLCRECNKSQRDNLVDIAGYAEVLAWAKAEAEAGKSLSSLQEQEHRQMVSITGRPGR